jgi:hypothetical protein
MPRVCSVCSHPDAVEINEALVIEKRSNRTIAKQYGLHYSAVHRHREHIPQLLAKSHEAEQATQADELLMEVRRLGAKTLQVLHRAESAGELNTMLRAVREARENVRLLAELRGKLDTQPVINLVLAPEWWELRALIVAALEPHPDARESVLRAIRGVENGAA